MDLPFSHSSCQTASSSRERAASMRGSMIARSSSSQGAPVASRYSATPPHSRAALRIPPLAAATLARTSKAKSIPGVWACSCNSLMASTQSSSARSGSFRESARNPRRLLARGAMPLCPTSRNSSWDSRTNASACSYSPVIVAAINVQHGERVERYAHVPCGARCPAQGEALLQQRLGSLEITPVQSYPSEKAERIGLSPPVPDLPIQRTARFEVLHRPHVVALPQLQVPHTKRRLAPDADRSGPPPDRPVPSQCRP